MKESTSFVMLILESLSLLFTWYIPKLTPSIGSLCFETIKKKLSLYVVFIRMNIAEQKATSSGGTIG